MPPTPRPRWPLAVVIFCALGLFFLAQSTHPTDPPEDAYITFRYARNLGEGHGLVWNVGEDPVEGSTEFLWAVILGGMHRLLGPSGPGLEAISLTLNLLIGAATVMVTAAAAFALSGRRFWPALFAAAAFGVGPVAYHARGGFATTLFTLLLLLSYLAVVIMTLRQHRDRLHRLSFPMLALSSLLLGLTRPEGVIFAALSLAAAMWLLSPADRLRLLRHSVLLLVVPGLIYFTWRWRYFGYPLPNTFYVKSSGSLLHLRYFFDIYGLYRFLAPTLLLIGIALFGERPERGWRKLVVLAPALIFPWAYLLIDQLQNLGMRFQYPVYPIYLVAGAAALARIAPLPVWPRPLIWRELAVSAVAAGFILFGLFVTLERELLLVVLLVGLAAVRWGQARLWRASASVASLSLGALIALAGVVIVSTQLSYRLAHTFYPTRYDDLKSVGEALQPFAGRGYTLVATEAGWLPYFSNWRTIDPFGLNDEHVTHQGLSAAYLDTVAPDVILFHEVPDPHPPRWADMVALLRTYAESRGFILAAVIERRGPEDTHVYYVRPDNPDAAALIEAITGQEGYIYQYRGP